MKIWPKIFSSKIQRKQFLTPGMIVIHILLLITTILWVFEYDDFFSRIIETPLFTFGHLFGLLGITFLSINFLLITRFGLLDKAFHGTDKVYIAHDFSGKLAFTFLSFHPVLMTLSFLPNTDFIWKFLMPGYYIPYDFGKIALTLLYILIALTVLVKIPYHIWKITHKFMALPLLFGSIHAAFIIGYIPLAIYIFTLVSLAFASYFYKMVLYRFISPKVKSVVQEVRTKGEVTEIFLKPEKKFNFRPGQFAFISFRNSKSISAESHPFTISSSPDDELLRISPKKSGDYTSHLPKLEAGTKAMVYGPHGEFGSKGGKDMLWIAGGIGVTPFLSMLRTPSFMTGKKVDLIYTVTTKDEAVYTDEINEIAKNHPEFKLHNYFSKVEGRLDAAKVMKLVEDVPDRYILLCGPSAMMNDLANQFMKAGIKPSRIFFEEFALI